MYTKTSNITDYEFEKEIDIANDYFDFNSFEIVDYNKEDYGFIGHKGRDVTIVYFRYNNKLKSLYLYGELTGLFKRPIIEEFDVLLKGDMFLVYSKTDNEVTVYNTLDWSIIESIEVTSYNLRTIAKRVTGNTVRKQFLY